MEGRLFDGTTSRGRTVVVTPIEGGLRLEGTDGEPPVFWSWADLPRSGLTVTGRKTVVRRNTQTLEVDDPQFLEVAQRAAPNAELFRSPFRTWIATPWRFAATLGSAAAALALAFFVLVPWAGDLIAGALPSEMEKLVGQSLHDQFVAGKEVLPVASERLQEFWDALRLPVDPETRLTVVDDGQTVNAFAVMGAQVFVYKGLIDASESSDELAGVLAHEAGHGVLRHSARLIGRSLAGAFLLSYLLSDPTGITGAVLGNVDTLRTLQFSREMESEADAWAARALASKTDIKALGTLLERIDTIKLPRWASFLGNHPATGDRVKAWSSNSAAHSSPELGKLFLELKESLE